MAPMKNYIPPNPAGTYLPPHDSPFMEQIMDEKQTPEEDRQLLRDFAENGYLIFDVELPDVEETTERVIRELAPKYPQDDHRLMEAWYFNEDVRAIACAPKVIDVLRKLYWREPIPFQTLNFKAGTSQAAHSDTVHFHCVPKHFMCGVWVALEDIDERCGPVRVYPGSHRMPTYEMLDFGLPSDPEHYQRYEDLMIMLVRDQGLEEVVATLKRGQAILWHANMLHGGIPVVDPDATRHSQVTHYYFEDCMYYFPMGSDPFRRQVCTREVIDLRDGRMVPHRYREEEVSLSEYGQVMTYPRPLPDFVQEPPASYGPGHRRGH